MIVGMFNHKKDIKFVFTNFKTYFVTFQISKDIRSEGNSNIASYPFQWQLIHAVLTHCRCANLFPSQKPYYAPV